MRMHFLALIWLLVFIPPCCGADLYIHGRAFFSSVYGLGQFSITDFQQDPTESRTMVNYSLDYVSTGFPYGGTGIGNVKNPVTFTYLLRDSENNSFEPVNSESETVYQGPMRDHVYKTGTIYFEVPRGTTAKSLEISYDVGEVSGKKSLVFLLKEPYTYYWNNAVELLNQTKYIDAVDEINKAIEIKPTMGQLYFVRGYIYYQENNIPQAISDFEKSISLDPHLPDPHLYLGEIYRNQSKNKEAIQAYTKYLELTPSDTTHPADLNNINHAQQQIKKLRAANQIPGFSACITILGLFLFFLFGKSKGRTK